jgi:uncharacterized membrane protein
MRIGYASRLEEDLGRWVAQGRLDEQAAAEMLDEVRSRHSGISFTNIAVFLGVASLALAAMTFVAANWQEMSRLGRLGLLTGAMWAAYLAAAHAHANGRPRIGDALVTLAAALFGALVMLTGQMYHLQGRAADAVLLWAAGSASAGLLLRSAGALGLTALLVTVWLLMDTVPEFGAEAAVNLLYPILWLGVSVMAWWQRSRLAGHFLAIGAIAWLVLTAGILAERHESLTAPATLYAALFAVVSVALVVQRLSRNLLGIAALAVCYAVALLIGLTGAWLAARAFLTDDEMLAEQIRSVSLLPNAIVFAVVAAIALWSRLRLPELGADLAFCALWAGLAVVALTEAGRAIPFFGEGFAIALSVWFIRMGERRDLTAVVRLGYLAFILVMGLIYFRTAGTLLGTAGFYLLAGLSLVLGAIFLPRLFAFLKPREQEVR